MRKFFISIVLVTAALFVVGCGTEGNSKNISPPEKAKAEMNILVIGESTAANFGVGLTYEAKNDVLEMNVDNQFKKAATPNASQYRSLAAGQDSSWLAYYGDLVFDRTDIYKTIRFVNLSVFEYTMQMWTPNYVIPGCLLVKSIQFDGEHTLNHNVVDGAEDEKMGINTDCLMAGPYGELVNNNRFGYIRNIKKMMDNLGLKFTHVIIQIGRADAKQNTSKENYIQSFNALKQGLNDIGIDAKIIMTRISRSDGTTNQNIIDAQNEIVNRDEDVFLGPNLDMVGEEYRYDGVNFNKAGLIKVAELYSEFVR